MATDAALIGRTLGGRFRVTGFIGEGAMACVYRGVQDAEPREVAIKVMHPQLLTDRTFVGRFRREAKAAAQIHHPNSVRILDFGVDDKLLYIAMELLAGQDLFEVLTAERRLSEQRAARIVVQVCQALSAAHGQGIVHRDLKPENVMLLRNEDVPGEERVKVLDFGIAKILERDVVDQDGIPQSSNSVTALTNVGMVVGTPAYMSPEQCRGEEVDARSDIYACGILLYQLVTGRLPFAATTAMDYAVMHVRTPPTPPSAVTPGIHAGLEALVMRALGKWPTERHASAQDLAEALEVLLPELSSLPFFDKRTSLAPLDGMGTGATQRQATPEPVTSRRREGSNSDVFRTLPSERKLNEAARASRADTLEATALGGARADATPLIRAHQRSTPADSTAADDVDGIDDAVSTPSTVLALTLGEDDLPTPLSRPLASRASTPDLDAPVPPVSAPAPSAPPASAPAPSAPPTSLASSRPLVAPASKAIAKPVSLWLVVPTALVIGLILGTLLFFLFR